MTGRHCSPILGAVMLVAALVSCSGDDGAPEVSPAPDTGSSLATFAVITHEEPDNTFWTLVRRGTEAAADEHDLDLQYVSDPNPVGQADLVRSAVSSNVDGIAVTLTAPEVMGPEVRSAVAAEIPVVVLNSGIADWKAMGALAFFGQDETIAGRAAGERFTREGARNVLCVNQVPGHVALEARCAGLAATFAGVTQTLYVDGDEKSTVKPAVTEKLQQDRSIDRILTLAAAVAIGALESVGEANSYAEVATFDTDGTVVQAIKNGTVEWAVDQQPYLQGYLAVDALWLYLTNKNVIGGGLPTLTGPTFIDESNIDVVAERAAAGTR